MSQFHCYTLDSFRDFVRHHPVLLYPAFIAQQRLRSTILGKRFWQRLEKRREQNPGMVTFQHLRFLVDRCQRSNDKQSPLFVEIVDYITNGGVRNKYPSWFNAIQIKEDPIMIFPMPLQRVPLSLETLREALLRQMTKITRLLLSRLFEMKMKRRSRVHYIIFLNS